MSQHASARWIGTYDIANPRRLARLFKYLKKQGVPVQYSVFLVEATAVQMGAIVVQMAKLVDPDADDVRAYRLPENLWKVTLGSAILPEGIMPGGGLELWRIWLALLTPLFIRRERCKCLIELIFSGSAQIPALNSKGLRRALDGVLVRVQGSKYLP